MSQLVTKQQAAFALGCVSGFLIRAAMCEADNKKVDEMIEQIYTYILISTEAPK